MAVFFSFLHNMNKIFIIAAAIFLFSFAKKEDDDFIHWTSKKLAWSDYKGEPDKSSGAAAITSTVIGMEYNVRNNDLTFTIECKFSKKQSWGRVKNDYILSHEQGHFDIAEIFARKLYKELSEYKFKKRSFQNDIQKIYNKIMDEKEIYQNKYDNQTDFSRNKKQQAEWLETINEELEKTSAYAGY